MPEGSISSIEVIGLKRTREHIAQFPLEQFLGRDAQTLDINEVMAAVKDIGVLEPLEIELTETDEGIILQVTVEEKWSFFPFPFFMSGSGETSFGLFLADTNAFGLLDQAVIGGMYGSSGFMGMVMYNHTPNLKGRPGWNTALMYGRQENEDSDKNDTIHRRYSADEFRISLRLNYPFTNIISGSAGISFNNISLNKDSNAVNQPEKGAALLGLYSGFSLRTVDWDGYLFSQQFFYLSYTYNIGIIGSSYHQVDFRGIYEYSLVPGFRLILRSGASWKSGSNILFEEGPNKAQVDILPWNYSARHYAGFSAGLEKHLVRLSSGTLSVLGSWQCVFSHGPLTGNKIEFNHGPSGGIRFYLSRIALPALGFIVAHNISTGKNQFSFSIGMGF